MSLKKEFLKSKPICKVTFRFPKEAAENAEEVHLVGDFNEWSEDAHPMKKLKDGSFKLTIDLDLDKEYQFRYRIDEDGWENDWDADKYVRNPYGDSENSVVVTISESA